MAKRMLIDGAHPEELRVMVVEDDKIQDFEIETTGKAQLKGNIYLAEVSRVEPSLQAAFITYGGNRNGFLAFNELHPSFFNVPEDERKDLLTELEDIASRRRNNSNTNQNDEDAAEVDLVEERAEESDDKSSELSDEELDEDARALAIANRMEKPDAASAAAAKPKIRRAHKNTQQEAAEESFEHKEPIHRRYKIADVLKEGQKILIQVVKEERGNKGAALTTYFTMPGRYTVLMPNTPYAGGISRKINNGDDRKALKEVFESLKVPNEMGLIIRTAGVGQDSKAIQKDFKNLTSLWSNIQKEFAKQGNIQCLHEDGSVVVRSLRDIAKGDVDEVIIEGNRIYKQAKDYAKSLMPEMAKSIREHKSSTPIFIKHGLEQQLHQLHRSRVELPSGGYLIINPTEALISVDVNSGRATQERNIEETALKTNLEAAEEMARQIRLRDLAGLIVIDFIDMEENRNNRALERAMRKAVRRDRARVQIANLSNFGLMEISRQRLRPSFGESHRVMCTHCNGTGHVHSLASAALMVLRRLEEEDAQESDRLIVTTDAELVIYILNNKRNLIQSMEAKYKYQILFRTDNKHMSPDFRLDLVRVKADGTEKSQTQEIVLREQPEQPPEVRYRKQNNRKGRKASNRRNNSSKTAKPAETENQKAEENTDTKSAKGKRPARKTNSERTEDKKASNSNKSDKQTDKPKRSRKKSENIEGDKPKTARRTKKADAPTEDKKPKTPAAGDKKKPATRKKAPAEQPKDKPLLVEKVEADGSSTTSNAQADDPASIGQTFQRWWSKS